MCVCFALNFIFHCYALFSPFLVCLMRVCLFSWRGVDLSLVVTLYGVYVFGHFSFFIFFVFFTEQQAYVCRDEERE